MRKGDTIPGLLSILFGSVFMIAASVNPQLTVVAKTADGVPGAGFFPYLLGGTIITFGILLTIRGAKQKGTVTYIHLTKECRRNVRILLLSLTGLLVFLVLWKLTGIFMAGILVLCLYLNYLFERTWKYNVIYSIVFTVFIYIVFSLFFSIQFAA